MQPGPLTFLLLASMFLNPQPPATQKRPVREVFHGVPVVDDYRWLENFSDPEVKAWTQAQNQYTRAVLDALPGRDALGNEIASVMNQLGTTYRNLKPVRGKVFAIKMEPARQQPLLVLWSGLDSGSTERVVFDPLHIDPTAALAIDFYEPSLDGRYVAISLSRLGSESGDLHIFETQSGNELPGDTIPRVNNGTAGGSVAWNSDSSGLFYTRYPRSGERAAADVDFYQQIYFHKLGSSSSQDRYEAGKDFPRIAEILLESSPDGKLTLATVANGDGGEFFHVLRDASDHWHRITNYSDQISIARFAPDDSLFLLSRQNAPMGKILHRRGSADSGTNSVVVPESDVAINDFMPAAKVLYVVDMAGGPSRVRAARLDSSTSIQTVPLRGIISISGITRFSSDTVLFQTEGYTQAPQWYSCNSQSLHPSDISTLSPPYPIKFDDAETVRDFAVSKDGTRVPLNIIRLKSTRLDGRNPVLLTGYGGFGISRSPVLNPLVRVLLNHGFVFVDTNLRGGAEYGEKWHLAGNLTHKQNVFDDFYACAQFVISHGYTSPSRLAIMGGSNGGLLMGAALTQHPEMYRAVLAFVGIYDMLHVELSPNGAFNATEYGTVKELDQFKALFAYSPYHNVRSGLTYPAAIFLTGDNDPRVDPANSRKMVARLQTGGKSKGPILLRTTSKAGHGFGSSLSESISQYTDAFSFLFNQLDVQ